MQFKFMETEVCNGDTVLLELVTHSWNYFSLGLGAVLQTPWLTLCSGELLMLKYSRTRLIHTDKSTNYLCKN